MQPGVECGGQAVQARGCIFPERRLNQAADRAQSPCFEQRDDAVDYAPVLREIVGAQYYMAPVHGIAARFACHGSCGRPGSRLPPMTAGPVPADTAPQSISSLTI